MLAAIIVIFIVLFITSSNRDHTCGVRKRKSR